MQVGRYQLEDQPSARGAQSVVYFGTRDDGLAVAMKVAMPGAAYDLALVQEIDLLQRLRAKGIDGVVEVLEPLRVDGRMAMVMPRYSSHLGEWLQHTIQQPTGTTLNDVLDMCARLARTLSMVHALQDGGAMLVHRDIKPENIFLDESGAPLLGDFGGAMAVESLASVELALFGTPMWAPIDQILPGAAIPDPTWDTYALCVVLYAAITGARPAYQANPTELLTERGHDLWLAARAAVEAPPESINAMRRAFAEARRATTAADVIDPTGRAALVPADRAALASSVQKLAGLAFLTPHTTDALVTGLWNLLVRGLSPLSHPSPPNRFRDAEELCRTLADLRGLIAADADHVREDTRRSLATLLYADVELEGDQVEPEPTGWLGKLVFVGGGLMLVGALSALAATVYLYRAPLLAAWSALQPLPAQVELAATTLADDGGSREVAAFAIDTTELTVARWRDCVKSGGCEPIYQPHSDEHPALGLSAHDAATACAFARGRLPTRDEWRVAHGPARYPWGDSPPDCGHATGRGCEDAPTVAGATRLGASPAGALDLAGNAWEWVTDGETWLLVGGGADSGPSELGAHGTLTPAPEERVPNAGVRCAYPR